MFNFEGGKFKKDKLAEVWGDIVAVKELLASIIISVILGLSGYLLAPSGNSVYPLLFSIVGIVIATIINSIFFTPKRNILVEKTPTENAEEDE